MSAAVALLASGCGGPSDEERFAEQVCATILPRAQDVLEVGDDVIHTRAAPGPDARVKLLSLAMRGTGITTNLRTELGMLTAPNTDAGMAAEGYIESIARFAFESLAAEERRVRKLPTQLTLVQSIRGLDRLEIALARAYTQMKSADLIGAGVPDMKESFDKADSCKALDALRAD